MNVKIMGDYAKMGALKSLYQHLQKKFDESQTYFGAPVDVIDISQKRALTRAELADHLRLLECALLLTQNQQEGFDLETESDEEVPFDEMEFILKNSLTTRQFIENAKDCIGDLEEISFCVEEDERRALYSDALSVKTLNMLHRLGAQVMLLTGDDAGGTAQWFAKEPRSFVHATLVEMGRDESAFDAVAFEKDLSSLDLDYNEFLHKQDVVHKSDIKKADEAFNKEAIRLKRLIDKWDKSAQKAKGEYRSECEYQRERAKKDLALGIAARKNAVYEAFRAGVISEYYFDKRKEQLAKGDFSRVPELFEADALKDRRAYLKEHDLQDLEKEEADSILAIAKKKAERDKKSFYIKRFLMLYGLASAKRYEISEMKIEQQLLYRGFVSERAYMKGIQKQKGARISVDVDDPTAENKGATLKPATELKDPNRMIEPMERRI